MQIWLIFDMNIPTVNEGWRNRIKDHDRDSRSGILEKRWENEIHNRRDEVLASLAEASVVLEFQGCFGRTRTSEIVHFVPLDGQDISIDNEVDLLLAT